jgi:septal ring factor EnvC (AmiA/AmiB activator)
MWGRFLLFFCALFLSAALLPAQQYLITEQELQILESISASWETNRQNLLSQAKELTSLVSKLRAESATLKEQLSGERQTTKSLRKSFEQSESEHIKRELNLKVSLDSETAKRADAEKDVLEVRNQRNILAGVLLFVTIGLVVFLVLKLKRVI